LVTTAKELLLSAKYVQYYDASLFYSVASVKSPLAPKFPIHKRIHFKVVTLTYKVLCCAVHLTASLSLY